MTKKQNCDFSGIVSGTKGYLLCKFTFSDDWKGLLKVAEFIPVRRKSDFEPLDSNDSVLIPDKIVKELEFKIRVYGVDKNDQSTILTNSVTIKQLEG